MSATENIDAMIAGLDDWRGTLIADLRKKMTAWAPELTEGWKWGTPVWSIGKANVLAVGAFKEHVKVNFFKGAHLDDPDRLFNAGFDAKESRSIDIHQGDKVNDAALKRLIRAAAAQATSGR